MVGRLVQQQQVGLGRQRPGQRGAARLAAREARRVLRAGQAELLQQGSGRGAGRRRAEPGLDVVERRGEAGEVGLLRQVADGGAGLQEAAAAHRARSGPAAIFSSVDLPEPLRPTRQIRSPAPDGQLRAGQQRRRAEGEVDVLQEQQRRGHRRDMASGGAALQPLGPASPCLPPQPVAQHEPEQAEQDWNQDALGCA